MDLQMMNNAEKVTLCRKYFYGGFALLPFLWFINAVWFFRDAFLKEIFPEQRQIRFYVIISMIGSLFWTILISVWIGIFQHYRSDWGHIADSLSFIIPKGIA